MSLKVMKEQTILFVSKQEMNSFISGAAIVATDASQRGGMNSVVRQTGKSQTLQDLHAQTRGGSGRLL